MVLERAVDKWWGTSLFAANDLIQFIHDDLFLRMEQIVKNIFTEQ